MVSLCKLGEDLVERMLVLRSPIRRGKHAEKQHFCAAGLDLADHLVEILANRRGFDAAQRVIGAEGQDHEIGFIGERPIEACETVRGRIAGDTRIYDTCRDAALIEPCLEPCGKGFVRRQPETRSEAVAKIEDNRSARGGWAA